MATRSVRPYLPSKYRIMVVSSMGLPLALSMSPEFNRSGLRCSIGWAQGQNWCARHAWGKRATQSWYYSPNGRSLSGAQGVVGLNFWFF